MAAIVIYLFIYLADLIKPNRGYKYDMLNTNFNKLVCGAGFALPSMFKKHVQKAKGTEHGCAGYHAWGSNPHSAALTARTWRALKFVKIIMNFYISKTTVTSQNS